MASPPAVDPRSVLYVRPQWSAYARVAVRSLLRQRGFTFVAVLTLALGVGATTAIFSVVYGILLRPLPYPDADRLLAIGGTSRRQPAEPGVTITMLLIVGMACTIPARCASTIAPAQALRGE